MTKVMTTIVDYPIGNLSGVVIYEYRNLSGVVIYEYSSHSWVRSQNTQLCRTVLVLQQQLFAPARSSDKIDNLSIDIVTQFHHIILD